MSALLQSLGNGTANEIAVTLAEREPAEPEEGLSPEVVERLRRRFVNQ